MFSLIHHCMSRGETDSPVILGEKHWTSCQRWVEGWLPRACCSVLSLPCAHGLMDQKLMKYRQSNDSCSLLSEHCHLQTNTAGRQKNTNNFKTLMCCVCFSSRANSEEAHSLPSHTSLPTMVAPTFPVFYKTPLPSLEPCVSCSVPFSFQQILQDKVPRSMAMDVGPTSRVWGVN